MSNVIPFDYEGQPVQFSVDGWLNATKVATRLGKEPTAWLRQIETLEYICFMAEALDFNSVPRTELDELKELGTSVPGVKKRILELTKKTGLVRSKAGAQGGTWLHPKLAVVFARWLDIKFSVWCDLQIDALLHGSIDVKKRFESACIALEQGLQVASLSGKELSGWRWSKPGLEHNVDYWRDQLQMTLGLEAA